MFIRIHSATGPATLEKCTGNHNRGAARLEGVVLADDPLFRHAGVAILADRHQRLTKRIGRRS